MAKFAVLLGFLAVTAAVLAQDDPQEILRGGPLESVGLNNENKPGAGRGFPAFAHHRRPHHRFPGHRGKHGPHRGRGLPHRGALTSVAARGHQKNPSELHRMMQEAVSSAQFKPQRAGAVAGKPRNPHQRFMERIRAYRKHMNIRGQMRRRGPSQGQRQGRRVPDDQSKVGASHAVNTKEIPATVYRTDVGRLGFQPWRRRQLFQRHPRRNRFKGHSRRSGQHRSAM